MKEKRIIKDEYETIVEENSDDDFQPVVVLKKRKDRESVPTTRRSPRKQKKRPENYAHVKDNESHSEETYLSAPVVSENYELDSSDDDIYCANIISKSALNDSVDLHNSRMYSVFQQNEKDKRHSSHLTSSKSTTPGEPLKFTSSQAIKGQLKL